jgi:predicted RNase H-like HicB family nuclease
MAVDGARRYKVVLERNERGGFTVTVPAFPAIVTEGDTRDDALANATDAIRLYLESLRARKLPVPDDADVRIEEVRVPA